jgi:hypothetical protein
MLGVLVALYQLKWSKHFAFGLFNLLLIALNNYLYYILSDLTYLPIVQKLSFLSFLFWICCIAIKMYSRLKIRFEPQRHRHKRHRKTLWYPCPCASVFQKNKLRVTQHSYSIMIFSFLFHHSNATEQCKHLLKIEV